MMAQRGRRGTRCKGIRVGDFRGAGGNRTQRGLQEEQRAAGGNDRGVLVEAPRWSLEKEMG